MTPWQRKRKTEAILAEKGVPFLPELPAIQFEDEIELRTAEEVGIRIACLFLVVGHAFEPSSEDFKEYLEEYKLREHLTPQETSFMSNPSPDSQSLTDFTWRSEALFLLMWAAGLFEELPWPDHQSDTGEIVSKFPKYDQSPWPFIQGLKLRSKSDILDASDLIYRLHWAVRSIETEEDSMPGGVDAEVVQEWHHAINWISKYEGLDWDQETTDT
jgi:hypothetical protein